MRSNNIGSPARWLAFVACACLGFAARAADREIKTFQATSETSSENPSVLVGHWRKTTIVFESPRDEHLLLHADGSAEDWTVTASDRSGTSTGHWSVEGKVLKLSLGENTVSLPFTLYEGKLVFPNIPNRRGFWEKIE
jgi:hypothetical protein